MPSPAHTVAQKVGMNYMGRHARMGAKAMAENLF